MRNSPRRLSRPDRSRFRALHPIRKVLHRHHGAGIEPLNRAGARLRVRLRERVLVRQLERTRLDLFEGFDHERNLDRAHRLHLTIRIERDLLTGLERFHVDAPRRVDAARGPLDRRLQPLQRRLLWDGLTAGLGGGG